MHAYLGGICNSLGCQVLAVGGPSDHIHILCRLSRTVTIAKLVEDVKKSSSKWIKTKGGRYTRFRWQNGYGVFSVSESDAGRVKAYIASQEEHHRRKTFQDEYRNALQEHGVEYNERYVWD